MIWLKDATLLYISSRQQILMTVFTYLDLCLRWLVEVLDFELSAAVTRDDILSNEPKGLFVTQCRVES